MPVLTDGDLTDRLENDLTVEPIDYDSQIQPSSIDLCLGRVVKQFEPEVTYITPDMPVDGAMNERNVDEGDVIPVHPEDFLLIPTEEWVKIPDDLQGQVTGRSSIGRLGIEVHSTAGLIDPGFEGQIVLEVSNNANTTIELRPGMRIAQLVLHDTTSEAVVPYGSKDDAKYQRQTGATESRVSDDPDL